MNQIQYDTLMIHLNACKELPDYDGIMVFHEDFKDLICKAKGSKSKHQAWEGGYVDHLVECMNIGEVMYRALQEEIRPVEFPWASVVKVLYFHDVEKIFKYNDLKDEEITPFISEAVNDKFGFYDDYLSDEPYLIDFTDEEYNALEHIHGEKTYGENRIIEPLGAFCHCCDMLSARMWFDKPTKEEKEQ